MPFKIETPIDSILSECIAAVNDETTAKILSKYPHGKQLTMMARSIELSSNNMIGTEEFVAITNAWDWIKSVIALSNSTTDIMKASDIPEIRGALERFRESLSTL